MVGKLKRLSSVPVSTIIQMEPGKNKTLSLSMNNMCILILIIIFILSQLYLKVFSLYVCVLFIFFMLLELE